MGVEVISITVGGTRYTAFESINVKSAFNEAARSFDFEVAAEPGPSATNQIFTVGAKVQIYANSDLLLTGYVDRRKPRIDAKSALISVEGRSSSQDLIDGAAEHKTGRFKKKDPKEIGEEVSKNYSETGFETDQKLEKVDQYQLNPGETVFRCVEKLCRQQGMTLHGTAEGKIKITKAGQKRHGGGLIEGKNIKVGTADHNGSNRHSKYTVLGQRPFDHGVDALEIQAVVKDSGVNRHRPVIVAQDEDTTKPRAKKRAKNRRDRAAGDALKATIDTQGFRDEGGTIWTAGNLVWVESPFLDIAQDMLIESVTFRQDDKGSIATLALTDPKSYGGEGGGGGKGNKSGSSWKQSGDADDSETEGGEEL